MALEEDLLRLGLSDFIKSVRAELIEASTHEGDPILELKDVELEVSFVVGKNAKGGVKLWVVDAGGEYSKQQTQTVKLTMTPIHTQKTTKSGRRHLLFSPNVGSR